MGTFSSGSNSSSTMLSRLATKAVTRDFSFGRSLLHTTSAVSSKPAGKPDDYFDPWENPERDYVNFPTRRQLQTNLPVRHVIIPETFFKAFHAKTGVTGPYAFLTGLTTFLVSKEIWVLEHEFLAGIEFYIVIAMIIKYIGKPIIAHMGDNAEQEAQVMASSYEELIQAKKDAVVLQLEADYRSRLANAYTQDKQRLDYQMELGNVMRRVEQRHMVDWIISNVRKSITAKQEDEALKKCVADLKALAK